MGYTRLEAHPWTVVVDLPEGQFLAPLQRLRMVAWISVGLVGIISLIISILLVRGITRPIRSLTDTAIAVEQGQPFEPSDIQDVTSGRDEIAHLGRVFSGMVLALRQELTERKQAENALIETKDRYRMLAEQAGQMTYDYDIPTDQIRWSGDVLTITGFSIEEFQKVDISGWENLIHPDDREDALSLLDEAMKNVSKYDVEYRFRRKDGSYVFIEDTGLFLADDRGNANEMLGIMRDITDRKRSEEELAKHRDHLEELVQKRTAELQKTINLMAGREVRMAGLKEVIRKLCAQVESAGLTPVADDPLKDRSEE